MEDIDITVCVPVYGASQYMEKCCESLFRQTKKDGIEFIFVNDCTPDDSIKILYDVLSRYPERKEQVKVIEHTSNSGVGVARQTALNHAKGTYVIYCDPDDWVEVDCYELLVEKAIETGADVIFFGFAEEYSDRVENVRPLKVSSPQEISIGILNGTLHGSSCNKLIRRSLYIDNDITYAPGINMWEDVLVTTRLCYLAKTVVIVDECLYHYRKTNEMSYTTRVSHNSLKNMISVIGILQDFFGGQCEYKFIDALCNLKLTAKLNGLLWSEDKKTKRKYSKLYKEADKHILSYKSMSFYWRIALAFNAINQTWVFNLMARISKVLK